MAMIQIQNLSFAYPGALQPVFENVTLQLDTNWRLGLVGRNGRGKTTLLRLLLGQLKGQGSIVSPEQFEYFPTAVENPAQTALEAARAMVAPFTRWEERLQHLAGLATPEAMEEYGELEQRYAGQEGYTINEAILAETGRLAVEPEALARPYATLSGGEQVKLMLAALFLKPHRFLLVDEPTDHLDGEGRKTVARWLAGKQGFILVSHDRAFLDQAVEYTLAINRAGIELVHGNYSVWRHNRTLQDEYEKAENKKLESNIVHLSAAAKRAQRWSDTVENSKKMKGTARSDNASLDRGYIGHQAARMMQRSKAIEHRKEGEIQQQKALLKNVEESEPLKFHLLPAPKTRLLTAEGLSLQFGGRSLFQNLSFALEAGQRLAIKGKNGSGKSSLLHVLEGALLPMGGSLQRQSGLVLSTLPQNTAFLSGSLRGFAAESQLDESLFLTLLRKLNFSREAFAQPLQSYSEGQKKKVCLAASLARPAHLFIWDEPLNYIDVQSREQIEEAILASGPTMVFVEHDAAFCAKVATHEIRL
ncbi:MAG: ribosomal protection-like ABC-F family protein [Oscillospiraceae bacterium]